MMVCSAPHGVPGPSGDQQISLHRAANEFYYIRGKCPLGELDVALD